MFVLIFFSAGGILEAINQIQRWQGVHGHNWDDLFLEEPYCYTGKSIKDDSHALGHLRRKLFADEESDYPEPNRPVKSIEHTIIIIDSDED
jgi:hypothetical protein